MPFNSLIYMWIEFESRLHCIDIIAYYSRQPTFTRMVLETISQISLILGISKMWSTFFVLSILPEI